MRKFTVSTAAATILAALLAAAPAQADNLNGQPPQKGNQCYKFSTSGGGARDSRWGYWDACPQSASVAVARRHVRRHHSSR
jgi:uncharacterized membrane protein